VNAPSAYNILLGRPAINKLGAAASSRHMKMKFPSQERGVIVIKSDQKVARKCYENNLKIKRGVCMITARPTKEGDTSRVQIAADKQPKSADEVQEREIGGKKFKLGKSLSQELQEKIVEVITQHLDAFTWYASSGINLEFLCHRFTMDPKVRPVIQKRRKFNEVRRLLQMVPSVLLVGVSSLSKRR